MTSKVRLVEVSIFLKRSQMSINHEGHFVKSYAIEKESDWKVLIGLRCFYIQELARASLPTWASLDVFMYAWLTSIYLTFLSILTSIAFPPNPGVYILHENHIFSNPKFSKCIFYPYFPRYERHKIFKKNCGMIIKLLWFLWQQLYK